MLEMCTVASMRLVYVQTKPAMHLQFKSEEVFLPSEMVLAGHGEHVVPGP
jgi:hypothetical protein